MEKRQHADIENGWRNCESQCKSMDPTIATRCKHATNLATPHLAEHRFVDKQKCLVMYLFLHADSKLFQRLVLLDKGDHILRKGNRIGLTSVNKK